MIRALVFDFDGLILETEEPGYLAWRDVYLEHGVDLPVELWVECIGRSSDFFDPVRHLETVLERAVDGEMLREQQRSRYAAIMHTSSILPGVESYVSRAGELGLKRAIASSSTRDWVVGHVERLGLGDVWDCIRCWDDVGRAKPDPDLYLAAVECLGVRPDEAVAFEDSPNGALAARRAGLFCVVVPNSMTRGLDLGVANLRLESLDEVTLDDLLAHVLQQS